ncbi:anoctamin-like protein At1g73020 isoform X6 [Cynara cardunculus var. scolymus]|uniref:anoctamin-like protein At1g73020 isoform X6 n=1 Tax=Cynara cardunculus var. scolymus TaxID=59895 RepID=UPI000D62D0CC|nr:anoctamin-like protein At1g73020 isoform X6 [Cynara cardunculus var. scolymus]
MDEIKEVHTPYEMGVVVPKKVSDQIGEGYGHDCVEVLVAQFHRVGLIVDRVVGLHDEFLKLLAPVEILGKAAAELQLKKRTHIGVDIQFEWDEAEAFIRQADGSFFSWCERFRCYNHMIYGIVNKSESAIILKSNCRDVRWEPGESLVWKLETEAIVKEVFPLHDEIKRKQLLKCWALNWWDLTNQPIDEIYAYYGTKIATYFAFLGMYTKWLFFPAAFGLLLQLVDFGSLQLLVIPFFFICIISWAVLFFQFWKRKNSTLLARWQISYSVGAESAYKYMDMEWSSFHSSVGLVKKWGDGKAEDKENFQREEWSGRMMRFRNDAIIILSIICLQLPFELAYAHLYESIRSDIMKFGLTAIYLFAIQYFTQFGGKVSVKLIKDEQNENSEYRANSLVYKVFGLYFMQSYIGILYHAILHRNFMTLRQVIIQRLIISEVLENLMENSLPYIKYSYRKYRAVRIVDDEKLVCRVSGVGVAIWNDYDVCLCIPSRICFCCIEIRADALKILAMYRRPVPRVAATIGAWLNIFQFLIVVSICTNCVLLACLYDREGKWDISPGLAAILIMEHVLLLIKFGFSRIVPEEPDWVKANRMKNATQAQNMCSKQLLRNISGGRGAFVTGTQKTD